jgi:hypothetical protein
MFLSVFYGSYSLLSIVWACCLFLLILVVDALETTAIFLGQFVKILQRMLLHLKQKFSRYVRKVITFVSAIF